MDRDYIENKAVKAQIRDLLDKKIKRKKLSKKDEETLSSLYKKDKEYQQVVDKKASILLSLSLDQHRRILQRKRKELSRKFFGLSSQYKMLNRQVDLLDRLSEDIQNTPQIMETKRHIANEFVLINNIETLIRYLNDNEIIDHIPKGLVNHG